MDSGIRVSKSGRSAETIKMADVKRGDRIVIGPKGVRVVPMESRRAPADFEFMTSDASTEKPKGTLIALAARLMKEERRIGHPILWVCGPAIVHSGAGPLLEKLIGAGYVQILFAGNALRKSLRRRSDSDLLVPKVGVEPKILELLLFLERQRVAARNIRLVAERHRFDTGTLTKYREKSS